MRPLGWQQLAATALISALLTSGALAQTEPELRPNTTAEAPAAEQRAPAYLDPPPAPPNLNVLTNLVWLEQPDARAFARHYPREARQRNINARVVLDCVVDAEGGLNCSVFSEDPEGQGFAEATLEIARYFRVAPQTRDGVPTEGGRVRRVIRWVMS
jgi:periplasmic protein TonB